MKSIFVAAFLLFTSVALAGSGVAYECDVLEINSGQLIPGASYVVSLNGRNGGDVSTKSFGRVTPVYALDANPRFDKIYQVAQLQDQAVTFTKSSDGKAGVLKIQSTQPAFDGGTSLAQSFICTQ